MRETPALQIPSQADSTRLQEQALRREGYSFLRGADVAGSLMGSVSRMIAGATTDTFYLEPGSPAVGRSLATLDLRGRTRATIIAVVREGKHHVTPDADFVNIYGMWRKGPAEIERRQRERMETVLREAKLTLLDLRIRFIRPDVAIVHQSQETGGYPDGDGHTMPPQRELSIRVLVKEHGKWLTTAFQNTIVREAAPRAP